MQQSSKPTVHVDSFLYDEEEVDSLCDEGSLSRSYCLSCGSTRTAPLELHFLFESVLPDLSGRVLVDVGSRLGAVLYGVSMGSEVREPCCTGSVWGQRSGSRA
ncbi:hypothetical protein JOQ06_000772, partial [Pogonophryne albipinna]